MSNLLAKNFYKLKIIYQ